MSVTMSAATRAEFLDQVATDPTPGHLDQVATEHGMFLEEAKELVQRHGWPRGESLRRAADVLRRGGNPAASLAAVPTEPAPPRSPGKSAQERIEDAEFLDHTGVGATEAASRLGFPSAQAMEKWLERHDAYDLWLSFKKREAEGMHSQQRRRTDKATRASGESSPVEDLLALARGHDVKRIAAMAAKITALLHTLHDLVEADRHNAEARAEVARLKQELAAAQARLSPAKTGPGKPPRYVSATKSATGVDAKTIRAWAAGRGIDVPATGRVPATVVAAYQEAHAS